MKSPRFRDSQRIGDHFDCRYGDNGDRTRRWTGSHRDMLSLSASITSEKSVGPDDVHSVCITTPPVGSCLVRLFLDPEMLRFDDMRVSGKLNRFYH